MRFKNAALALAFLCFFAAPLAGSEPRAAGEIHIVNISDPIGPGVSDFLVAGIGQANAANAVCLIILLDTPGGLVDAMRDIVQAILGSEVPTKWCA